MCRIVHELPIELLMEIFSYLRMVEMISAKIGETTETMNNAFVLGYDICNARMHTYIGNTFQSP